MARTCALSVIVRGTQLKGICRRPSSGIHDLLVLLIALLQASPSILVAQEVKAKFKNLTVNANLELAQGKYLNDGIILIAHALIQHNRMEIIHSLQALFKQHVNIRLIRRQAIVYTIKKM